MFPGKLSSASKRNESIYRFLTAEIFWLHENSFYSFNYRLPYQYHVITFLMQGSNLSKMKIETYKIICSVANLKLVDRVELN